MLQAIRHLAENRSGTYEDVIETSTQVLKFEREASRYNQQNKQVASGEDASSEDNSGEDPPDEKMYDMGVSTREEGYLGPIAGTQGQFQEPHTNMIDHLRFQMPVDHYPCTYGPAPECYANLNGDDPQGFP